ADQQHPLRRQHLKTVLEDSMAALIAPVVKNVTENYDVRTLRIGAGEKVSRCRCETIGQAIGLNVLFGDLAHRSHIHDNATQVRIPEPYLDRDPARSSRNIH